MEIGVKACKKVPGKLNTFCTGGIGGSEYFEFEIGQTYSIPENPVLCRIGYHYFRKEDLCFGINFFGDNDDNEEKNETVFVEIQAEGEIVFDTFKRATNKFTALRYIPKKEWKKLIKQNRNSGDFNSGDQNSGGRNSGNLNSGNSNSGHRNSGNSNSGHRNSGDWNSGNSNSGDRNSGNWNSGNWNSGRQNSGNWNSGDWNSGNYNSGYWNSGDSNLGNRNSGNWNLGDSNSGHFNLDTPKTIRVFGKDCLLADWEAAKKPKFLYFDQRDGESYQEAFQRSWDEASSEDRKLIEKLPNFDWEIFTKISGIRKPE